MTLETRNVMNDEPVDRLLKDFFQAEMPKPWPRFAYPKVNGSAVTHPFQPAAPVKRRGWWGRVALAASVALLFVGYLSLAKFFPSSSAKTPGLSIETPEIAKGLREREAPGGSNPPTFLKP